MNKLENINWNHSFFEPGPDFDQAKEFDPVAATYPIEGNPDAPLLIGLDPAELERQEFVEDFSGNRPLSGEQPLAMDYSGHQFGSCNPRLGDGRGLLLEPLKRNARVSHRNATQLLHITTIDRIA
jgi:uncharacterized protein YdiU (UPF0061 family)